MTKDINTGDTQDTNSGETATYRDTIDNAGTYDNAGTVDLQDAQEFAESASVETSGWSVSVTHPESGRVIRPSVINPDQVQFLPGPNMMPRIRLPVRRAPSWLNEEYDDNPDMSVHLDGEELPIDELVDVEQEEGQTILVGEGGVELREVVDVEYDAERRPVAGVDLVDANTTYNTVDNSPAPETDSRVVQDPSGESELGSMSSFAEDVPLEFTGGGVKPAQSCFTQEAEDYTAGNETGVTDPSNPSDFSSGDWASISRGSGATGGPDYTEHEFTLAYTIPASEFSPRYRFKSNSNGTPAYKVELDHANGNTYLLDELTTVGFGAGSLAWRDTTIGDLQEYDGPDLTPGTYTFRIEATDSNGTADNYYLYADCVAPLDELTRVTGGSSAADAYTFDNTVNTANGWLDGPQHHPPAVDAVFDAYESAFSIVGGSATATINDTSNEQALALSNDRGASYPITASNTTSVSGSFSSPGASLLLKATLGRYSPQGERDQTPRTGYDAQRLDGYELTADVEYESLLIDDDFENTLASVLNNVLGNRYAWRVSVENEQTTVTIDEPGNTVADRDPEISDASIKKQVTTYSTVTIKGSHLPVDGEDFQASTSYVSLAEDNIKSGSEAVTDDSGTQYVKDVDYEIRYGAGEIRILAEGNMTSGTSYNISYEHRVKGSHTVPGASGGTLPETIPGVTSDRQAEQIAYVLAEVYPGVATPRYEGEIVVPRLDATFDPLEGLQLADMDLPDVARPLSIRGEPELTPLGLTLRLGSAPSLEESLRAISEQVSAVSDRV